MQGRGKVLSSYRYEYDDGKQQGVCSNFRLKITSLFSKPKSHTVYIEDFT